MPDPTDTDTYDVFISYSSHDKNWVRGELLRGLEAAKLRVCIDYRDFEPGAPIVAGIERAIQASRKTLLILTPAHLQSEWAELEDLLLHTLDPAYRQRRLIPLRLVKCDLPLRIRGLSYIDFAEPEDEKLSWRQLLTALGAPPPPEAPVEPARSGWLLAHPYGMPPNFTGRAGERTMLTEWLNHDPAHPLLVLRALGGFGKSALTWHWLLNDVVPARWPQVVWWSFYESEAGFESFLAHTLAYLGVDPRSLGPRQQVDALLQRIRYPGLLLVLDGFERALRAFSGMDAAYRGDEPDPPPNPLPLGGGRGEGRGEGRDCLSPLAEHFLRSLACLPDLQAKVLMTTRLTPRVLEGHGGVLLQGGREEELTQMQPADAVTFFRSQGIRGSRAEIEAACEPYGYHPLSLRLLAGLIVSDLQQPGDIAAARRLDVSGDLVQRRHHVLEQAYTSLPPVQQQLLSRIACFRSPVGYEALHALAEQEDERGFDSHLRELITRGLLHHDRQTNRYDLHPIVRRYAYDRLADPTAAHARLRDYFAAISTPERVLRLEELAPVIELYHHTVRAGQYDAACDLFYDRINQATFYQFGAYQLRIELLRALFPDGEDRPPRLKDEGDQAWTLNTLSNSYSLSGQPRRAVPLFEQQIASREKQGDKQNLAIGLGNLAIQQMPIGALRAAEANLRRCIDLGREIGNEFNEAIGYQELGRLLAYRGIWAEAVEELAATLALFEKEQHIQGQGMNWAYRALQNLLLARAVGASGPHPPTPSPGQELGGEVHTALAAARRALELADETANDPGFVYPVRDYVDIYWLLGAAHRANNDFDEADRRLSEALTRCRGINAVDAEADILLDLARLRAATGEVEEAWRLAEEALVITERSGYVLQGADVHCFLAERALAAGDKAAALAHAQQARQLAACDGEPYTYKVAYEEAGGLLERLRDEG